MYRACFKFYEDISQQHVRTKGQEQNKLAEGKVFATFSVDVMSLYFTIETFHLRLKQWHEEMDDSDHDCWTLILK